ncbi:hypothetical protein ACFLS9_01095 [Bacteroidota bacterium]
MKKIAKEKLSQLIQLYLLDELNPEERNFLEDYIKESEEAACEFKKYKQIHLSLSLHRPVKTSENDLLLQRQQLIRNLRSSEYSTPPRSILADWLLRLKDSFFNYALTGATSLIIGLFCGYLIFSSQFSKEEMFADSNIIDIDKINEYEISDIRFLDSFPDKEKIQIAFNAVKPFTYSGEINDKIIQQLLAIALITETNPGIKIQTVNKLAINAEQNFAPDPKIKSALITSLKVDENPGVRKAALNLLTKFPYDEKIRDSFLYVLVNDQNSGMRVTAINALSDLKFEGISIDEKIKYELNKRAESDKSEFIKIRAASLLKGEE